METSIEKKEKDTKTDEEKPGRMPSNTSWYVEGQADGSLEKSGNGEGVSTSYFENHARCDSGDDRDLSHDAQDHALGKDESEEKVEVSKRETIERKKEIKSK